MIKEIRLPDYEGNEDKYRNFILRHKNEIINDTICNSEVAVEWAEERKDLSKLNFGETGEIGELVWHLLKKRGIISEYIPRGYGDAGLGYDGQLDNIIELDDGYSSAMEIQELVNGSLDW